MRLSLDDAAARQPLLIMHAPGAAPGYHAQPPTIMGYHAPVAPHAAVVPPKKSVSRTTAYVLDFVLGCIMGVAALGFLVYTAVGDSGYTVHLWKTDVVTVVQNTSMYSAANVFEQSLYASCPSAPHVSRVPMYCKSYSAWPTAVQAGYADLRWLVFFVAALSSVFQLGRAWTDYTQRAGPSAESLYAGPCISRWLEYALTSPLQVVLVAIIFHIYDERHLWTLAAAQAGLVLLGYAIERELLPFTECVGAKERLAGSWLAVLVLSVGAWGVHIFIWVLVMYDANRGLWEMFEACWSFDMDRTAADVLFWGQAVLFSVFGIVSTGFVLMVYTGRTERGARPWIVLSIVYNVASVVAKLLLIISFIFYAETNPAYMQSESDACKNGQPAGSVQPDATLTAALGTLVSAMTSLVPAPASA